MAGMRRATGTWHSGRTTQSSSGVAAVRMHGMLDESERLAASLLKS